MDGAAQQSANLDVKKLVRAINGRTVISDLSFSISTGEILFVRGPSGVGKSLLLRCLAHLDPTQGGEICLDGKTPLEMGVTTWRSLVTYVPQTRVHPKGTPAEFYSRVQQFAAQKGRSRGDLPMLIQQLGLEEGVLDQLWTELSGGQAQRVVIAVAVALRPLVLLLDEPTSALDPGSAELTESVLRECGSACVWVSHDPLQPKRVGGRVLELPLGLELGSAV